MCTSYILMPCSTMCRIADWHARLNNKMGGDLAKIQTVGRYFEEVWRAVGMQGLGEKVWILHKPMSVLIPLNGSLKQQDLLIERYGKWHQGWCFECSGALVLAVSGN